ncbi:MAG: hypothetical protein AAFY83_10360 [Pseudomonadota bacterium]
MAFLTKIRGKIGTRVLAACLSIGMAGTMVAPVSAETATFVTPVTNGDPVTLLMAGNNAGVVTTPGQSIGVLLSQPFATFASNGFTPINNSVSLAFFTDIGVSVGNIAFGRLENGIFQSYHNQNFSTGSEGVEIDFNFLAFVGCGVNDGCNYFQVTTTSNPGGSSTIFLDSANFNGVELSQLVAASTPEPQIWVLMIAAFAAMGWQLKRRRAGADKKSSAQETNGVPGLPVNSVSDAAPLA